MRGRKSILPIQKNFTEILFCPCFLPRLQKCPWFFLNYKTDPTTSTIVHCLTAVYIFCTLVSSRTLALHFAALRDLHNDVDIHHLHLEPFVGRSLLILPSS